MVHTSKIKVSLLRVLIVTGLMMTAIFPESAQALTQDLTTDANTAHRGGASSGISKVGQTAGQFAPLAGNLPSGTPFLPSLLVNTTDTSTWIHPSTDPAAIAYWPPTGKLLITDTEIEESPQPFWHGFNVFQSTLTGGLFSNCTTFTGFPLTLTRNNFTDEPSGIAVKPDNTHIFFSDDTLKKIFDLSVGPDNTYCTSDDTVTSLSIGGAPFNVTDPEDIAYGNKKLYIAGGQGGKVYVFDLGANGVLGGGDDSTGALPQFDTVALGFSDVEGIAYNATDDTLYIVSTIDNDTYLGETSTSGSLLRAYDLSYLGNVRRSGLTLAPSSTDPSSNNIYIVSRGVDNAVNQNNNDGKIWEIDITNPTMPDLIFKDGFESGNFSAWTSSNTNSGNLSANLSAALFDSYGMRAVINSTTSMDVTDDRPTLERRYRARFYFDPNSIAMAHNESHEIFQGHVYLPQSAEYTDVLQVQFRYNNGNYQVRGRVLPDATTTYLPESLGWASITDALHFIELDWSAATAVGANDGYLTLWVDGNETQSITGVDNDTRRIDRAKLGAVSNLDVGTTGTYYFDAFESRRQSYIGPVVVASGAVVDVNIAGSTVGNDINIPLHSGARKSFVGVDNGPVQVVSTNGVDIIAAERVIYKVNGVNTSFSEMMGLPNSQLDTTYWLPWYNNVTLDTQLRFANVSGAEASVHVYIGGVEMLGSPFTLAAGASTRKSFVGIDKGPVKIESNVNIVAAERVIYKVNNVATSFSEMMALPNSQLDNTYWLPWYNNVTLDTQLRFANVSGAEASVHVYIGGTEMVGSPFTLAAGASTRKSFVGIDKGPVKIESNVNIVAAERVIYKVNNVATSFSEMMALPNSQLDNTYWLPWYNNVTLDTQLRFANVSGAQATVHVTIGGVEMTGSPFILAPGASTRKSFVGIDKGPVKIESDVDIVAAERVIYTVNNVATSFSEMMALPNSQLDIIYWLPWYNNIDLDTQLRFGTP